MSTPESAAAAGIPWKAVGTGTALALVAFLMFIALPEADNEQVVVAPTDQTEVKQQLRSEQELTRIFSGMRAGHLDSTLDRQAAVDDLNRWANEFPLNEGQVLSQDEDLLRQLIPGDFQESVLGERFTPNDAGHIRMSLLASQIVSTIKSRVKHEVPESDPGYEIAVITAAFHYVWQNVGEDAQQRVLTPYEVFIYGRGTPPDRIWCFAELARQLACDTVLIAPKQAEQPLPPLVGVLTTRDELLLFEPSLGIPLADLSATPTGLLPNTPATLKEVLETPDFFKNYQFAAVEKMGLGEFAYPIKHEHLKSVEILIAGHPSQWAPRMASVEFRTPSDQEALFYTGLGQNSLRQNGAYDRVVGVGAKNGWWAANDVQVWLDPLALDIRLEQDRNSPATSAANWQQMNRIMQGPEVVNATVDGIELAQRSLEDVRIEQLTGKSATALSHLLAIRNANQQYKSDINAYAADFATFRTAQCQMDIGQWPAATQTLLGYLNVSSGHQLWTKEAVEHLAWIQMQELEIAPPEAEVNPLAPFIVFRQLPEISYRQLFQLHYWARVLQASGRLGGLENASPTGSGDASSGRPPSPPLPTPLAE